MILRDASAKRKRRQPSLERKTSKKKKRNPEISKEEGGRKRELKHHLDLFLLPFQNFIFIFSELISKSEYYGLF